jgi:hypothetical protein
VRGSVAVAVLAVLVGNAPTGHAQLAVSNLLEAQSGNLPFRDPADRTDLYEQFNLDASFGDLRLGLRYESDQNSEDRRVYRTFTQRYADWTDGPLRLRVGNLYTMVGRGLIHRSFELPGVVLDKDGNRSKYAFSRDLDGVLAEFDAGAFEGRLFSGKPNGGEFSPGIAVDRYRGHVSGGQFESRFLGTGLAGVGFVRQTTTGLDEQRMGTLFASFDLLSPFEIPTMALPLYVEYAELDTPLGKRWRFATGDDLPHALYASSEWLWGPFALSAEWKDYVGFRFGTNDPPSLVREHTWTLLNRSTHVLDAGGQSPPTGESGFQLEGTMRLPGQTSVTANLSRSDGVVADPDRFDEAFVELHWAPMGGRRLETTAFYDHGMDGDLGITVRDAVGARATLRAREVYSVELDGELQNSTREFEGRLRDTFASITFGRAGWGTAALVWERSTDPQQESPDDGASPGIQPRHFVSGTLGVRITDRHEATLFAGERRGGRACTAGTCYEVLPFKGVELRLISRL